MFREYQSDFEAIGLRRPNRGVVHVENQIRALGDELGGPVHVETLSAQTWVVLAEQVGAFLGAAGSFFVRLARDCVSHPAGSGRQDYDAAVMQDLRVTLAHLGGDYPPVFREIYLDADILIVNRARG